MTAIERTATAAAPERFLQAGSHSAIEVRRIPLGEVRGWVDDREAGVIRHHSGRFFSIVGIAVDGGPARWSWHQPIIDQPDIGVLGALVRDRDGTPEILVQAKVEPGNVNGLQAAPTVQATSSNYSGVHGGRAVPYLELFLSASALGGSPTGRARVDREQSEQGSWFDCKSNRNMVVSAPAELAECLGFTWMELPEVRRLLAVDDLVGMDMRTVLCCLESSLPAGPAQDVDSFAGALERSRHTLESALGSLADAERALRRARAAARLLVLRRPLTALTGWRRDGERITHDSGAFFDIIGVSVRAHGREVDAWDQPMLAAAGTGLVALLVCRVDGVLHLLMRFAVEPGLMETVELGPTVQATPENYVHLPAANRPAYLDAVLAADPASVRFDTVLSDEGGRLYHARSRHLVVEVDHHEPPPGHRWLTLGQVGAFVLRGHAVNMEGRSVLACLHSLVGRTDLR